MSCAKCVHFNAEYGDYESGGHLELLECQKNPGYGNLKSFPFKKMKDCFRLDFWFSEFAEQLTCNDEHDDKIFKAYVEKYPPNDIKN